MLTSPHADVYIRSEANTIALSGTTSNHEGLKGKVTFTGRVAAMTKGGSVTCSDGILNVTGADEATIYVSIATNFKHYDDISANDTIISANTLQEALACDYTTMRQKHIDKYTSHTPLQRAS